MFILFILYILYKINQRAHTKSCCSAMSYDHYFISSIPFRLLSTMFFSYIYIHLTSLLYCVSGATSGKYRVQPYEEGDHTLTLSLRIHSIQADDYGEYRCVAANTLGADHQSMYLYRKISLLSPAGAVGPGTGDIATPPVRLSVCLSVRPSVRPSVRLSVRPSRLVFAL